MSNPIANFEAQVFDCVAAFQQGLQAAGSAYTNSDGSLPTNLLRNRMLSMGESQWATNDFGNGDTAISDVDLAAQQSQLDVGDAEIDAIAGLISNKINALHQAVSEGRCGVDPVREEAILADIKQLTQQNATLRSEVIQLYDATMVKYNAFKGEFDKSLVDLL